MLTDLAGTWWAWVILGFALGVLEIIVPGFIFLGFAIGAIVSTTATLLNGATPTDTSEFSPGVVATAAVPAPTVAPRP